MLPGRPIKNFDLIEIDMTKEIKKEKEDRIYR